ncbi:MAG: hypothetical protein EPN99_17335 [Frankiales bacterium]|nr:MAG: hypothetical protein EPN99_17335 [Frankiales bacterium]
MTAAAGTGTTTTQDGSVLAGSAHGSGVAAAGAAGTDTGASAGAGPASRTEVKATAPVAPPTARAAMTVRSVLCMRTSRSEWEPDGAPPRVIAAPAPG